MYKDHWFSSSPNLGIRHRSVARLNTRHGGFLESKPLPQNLWVIIASFHANHRVFIGYDLKKLVSNLTVEFCECRQLEKYGIATDLETQLDET